MKNFIKNMNDKAKAKKQAKKEAEIRIETQRQIEVAKAKAEHEAFLSSMSPEERKIYFLEKELKEEKAKAEKAKRSHNTFYDYMVVNSLANAASEIATANRGNNHNNRRSNSNGLTEFKAF